MKCLRTEIHCGFCHAALLYAGRAYPVYSAVELEDNRRRGAKARMKNANRVEALRQLTTAREIRVHPDGIMCMTYERTGKTCHHKKHTIEVYRG